MKKFVAVSLLSLSVAILSAGSFVALRSDAAGETEVAGQYYFRNRTANFYKGVAPRDRYRSVNAPKVYRHG